MIFSSVKIHFHIKRGVTITNHQSPITNHQASPSIIKHHQASPSITKHHQASPSIIKHHQASPSIIKHHRTFSRNRVWAATRSSSSLRVVSSSRFRWCVRVRCPSFNSFSSRSCRSTRNLVTFNSSDNVNNRRATSRETWLPPRKSVKSKKNVSLDHTRHCIQT